MAIKDLIESITENGIDFYATEFEGHIVLDKIIVPNPQRGGGFGSECMGQLTEYADSVGKRIELALSTDFGSDEKRLFNFYRRFGFRGVENGKMIREKEKNGH